MCAAVFHSIKNNQRNFIMYKVFIQRDRGMEKVPPPSPACRRGAEHEVLYENSG
jgi:hypothetical protein